MIFINTEYIKDKAISIDDITIHNIFKIFNVIKFFSGNT